MREFAAGGDFRDWPQIEAWADGIAGELRPAAGGRIFQDSFSTR
ncbi:MAG: hypothetical protein ABSE70_05620 [Candidatus Limnocylindrales bacterium]